MRCAKPSIIAGSVNAGAIRAVSVGPGATALTVTPVRAHSTARVLVIEMTAAFEAL